MKLSLGARIARDFMYVCRFLPIKRNKVVFASYYETKYSDSPRFISEALADYPDVEQVWILPSNVPHPAYVRTVKPQSVASLYELATARVWVDNVRKKSYIRKRKGQYYIQTWHGGVAFKRVEADAVAVLRPRYVEGAQNDSAMADLFISNSEWVTKLYRRSFWYQGEIMQSVLPRDEVFYRNRAMLKLQVYSTLGINEQVRLAMYAPTFRREGDICVYNLDTHRVLNALCQRFGGEWKLLVRLHPHIAQLSGGMVYDEQVIDCSAYGDINELIMASEILISDYSSCTFDAMLAGNIVFLYASDLKTYTEEDRGLYFDIHHLPAPLAETNEALIDNILTFDESAYHTAREHFNDQIGYYTQHDTSNRVASRIHHWMCS